MTGNPPFKTLTTDFTLFNPDSKFKHLQAVQKSFLYPLLK
jgi:hypothetical protein